MNNVVPEKPNLDWYDYLRKELSSYGRPFLSHMYTKSSVLLWRGKKGSREKRMFTNLSTNSIFESTLLKIRL